MLFSHLAGRSIGSVLKFYPLSPCQALIITEIIPNNHHHHEKNLYIRTAAHFHRVF